MLGKNRPIAYSQIYYIPDILFHEAIKSNSDLEVDD